MTDEQDRIEREVDARIDNLLRERPINFPLLWKVYDHIVAHPDEWMQRQWAVKTTTSSCGTAFCVAGHAAVMTGHTIAWDDDLVLTAYVVAPGTLPDLTIENVAKRELGLTSDEADVLFRATNTLEDIHDILMAWEERVL
jgi:hypothetical protein